MEYKRTDATLRFDSSAGKVKAISGARQKTLSSIGVDSVRDLLTHYPFRYMDMSQVETTVSAAINETCTVVGVVHEITLKKPRPRLNLVEIALVDSHGILMVTCFRQPWLVNAISAGDRIVVSGTVEFNYGFKRMTNPFIENLKDSNEDVKGTILPVHHSTEKLTPTWMRTLVSNALEYCLGIIDPLPLSIRQRYRLPSRQHALRAIHFPVAMSEVESAKRRLTYEEVLLLELHLIKTDRDRWANKKPHVHETNGPYMAAFSRKVPFDLTEEQKGAKADILAQMSASQPMNHMVLGDVGTGKTILAGYAIAAAADTGTQVAMMAPTEVLAQQYGIKLGSLLDEAGIRWGLLTGSTKEEERSNVLQALENKEMTVLFGTQALLEEDVKLPYFSLAIIDEQQRFGVAQREVLLNKGDLPDVLYLTATPIPRTMALALYGNMTLSYIKQRPLNISGNVTRVLNKQERGIAFDAAREALKNGKQVYIVCPLVGESKEAQASDEEVDQEENDGIDVLIEDESFEESNVKAAKQEATYLQNSVFVDYRVELMHGRLPNAEKQEVMEQFRSGEINVLVATTAIEVGVDVENASVMIVQDADRFGLAQLHQLRGRVGRGTTPGEVFLISGTKAPIALQRLAAMEQTEDGFELAQYDLSLRKEGDILGNRQHGSSSLKLVNVVRDGAIIEAAHTDALQILSADPRLEKSEHRPLKYEMQIVFADSSKRDDRR